MSIFDTTYFNGEVFSKYLETVPRVKQNAFIQAGVLRSRPELATLLAEQAGGNFISVPMNGLIGGTALNYDGATNITADSMASFLQSMIVVGRAKAWEEKDFAQDVSGNDFMSAIASQVADYWDEVDNATILAELAGIFSMSGSDNFVTKHTLDITGESNPNVNATTLNSAIQKAAGANKNIFTMAIMHSAVATNLENLQLLEYTKYTDANGIQKDTALATWNGRTVLIDDTVPAVEGESGTTYTTYLLGQGAFDYVDCGAKVASEVYRQPTVNGGSDMLITRQRKVFAPRGISFVQPSTPIISPTDANLQTGARWAVVKDTAGTGFYDSKAIPLAQIKSLG